jgi:hypothetical protein
VREGGRAMRGWEKEREKGKMEGLLSSQGCPFTCFIVGEVDLLSKIR